MNSNFDELKLDAVQAILDDIAPSEPRAKSIKAQALFDRQYLDDMERSGFMEKLWSGTAPR